MHDLFAEWPLPLEGTFAFRINYADCRTAADIVCADTDRLRVLFRLKHEGDIRITSDAYPIDLQLVLAGRHDDMGPVEAVAETGQKETGAELDHLVSNMPWLQFLDCKEGFSRGKSGAAGSGHSESGDPGSDSGCAIDEDEILAGLRDLERAHADAAVEVAATGARDFVPRPRGGPSQIRETGEGVHAMQGQTTNADAEAWARLHGATTFKCTFTEHGVDASKILVRAWCHRMQYFFDAEMAAPEGFAFTPDVVASYMEPTELVDLVNHRAHEKWRKWMARIAVIRAIPRY